MTPQPPYAFYTDTDTEAWMHFGEDWDDLDKIDQTIWTVRRLSEYYVAQEKRRTDKAAS